MVSCIHICSIFRYNIENSADINQASAEHKFFSPFSAWCRAAEAVETRSSICASWPEQIDIHEISLQIITLNHTNLHPKYRGLGPVVTLAIKSNRIGVSPLVWKWSTCENSSGHNIAHTLVRRACFLCDRILIKYNYLWTVGSHPFILNCWPPFHGCHISGQICR